MVNVETHNLAVRIYDALNKKGAGLGNASIGIIESAIEASAQPPRALDGVHAERTMIMSCPSCHRLIEIVLLASLRQ